MATMPRSLRDERLDVFRIARLLAEDTLQDFPIDLKRVLGAVRARDLKTLASLVEIRDREYQDPEIQRIVALRQIQTLFSKNEVFSDDRTCSKAAQDSFLRAERLCRITNKRLDWFYARQDRLDPVLANQLRRMESAIASLLGDLDSQLPHVLGKVRLTSGATEDRTRKRSYPFLKLTGKLRAPVASIPYIGNRLLEMGVDLSSCKFTAVENNTVVFVPKSWKTHRTIAKEPTHSLPFQLALDSFLKGKLRRWGVDLSSQEKNQKLARVGSLDGSLATLDMSMASDTLSFNAVAWMLPYDWFKLFCSFRSSSYSAPFGSGAYAKYSSMGNGYTFTLETLIFAAACRAVGSQQYAVYGDDIVIETDLVTEVQKLLNFLGFRFNRDKTFLDRSSRFRESCGHDYYKGVLVTPFYLRETPKVSDKSGMCHAINGLIRETLPGRLWDYLLELALKHKLRFVPFNEDTRSGVFISPSLAWRSGRLRIDNRRTSGRGVENPSYGQPVYDGYSMRQDVRKTTGWRSLLLWHVNANWGGGRAPYDYPKRTSQLLLTLNAGMVGDLAGENITSRVAIRTRYVHATRRFAPVHYGSLGLLFLWDEYVERSLAR